LSNYTQKGNSELAHLIELQPVVLGAGEKNDSDYVLLREFSDENDEKTKTKEEEESRLSLILSLALES
jgi:hypothetical protein